MKLINLFFFKFPKMKILKTSDKSKNLVFKAFEINKRKVTV